MSWGFFNTAFERKEYMEAYVAEDVAEQMLKNDPALRQEFEKRLSEDPEFARRSDGAAGLLLSPPPVVGRALQPVSGVSGRRSDCNGSRQLEAISGS